MLQCFLNKNNSLEFCELDLLNDDGWDAAVKGCDYVLHLASPVYEKDNSDESALMLNLLNKVYLERLNLRLSIE